ncbi:hypothetical protein M758_6G050400 [Ceratodon purpureus]|nr:hypothetical protein M758_6G050400 [Ceratodon purpureus]
MMVMVMMGGMWKLLAVTVMVVALVAQCGVAQNSNAPVSRTAPYSVTINAGKNAVPVVVIQTGNYIVSLEGNPCAITIRHLFSSQIAHLVWTANYYVGSLVTATKCTLEFTTAGDLQLFALFKGTNTMIWHSNTAGKGIVKMALENKFDSGDLQLLTKTNAIVYHSFGVKEFAILPTQKFMPGETLVAPDAAFNDNILQVLFSGDRYFLKLQSGDLRLYSNFGKGLKQYWTLKNTLAKNVDLSQVAYASIVTDKGGIGLFKSNGAVVWTSGPINSVESNAHDTYFSVDPDGNLRTYFLVKGQFWDFDFVAIPNLCDLPNSCGEYGVCSNGKCSCLPQWVPNKPKDLTQGCKTLAPFTKCGSGKQQFLSFTGYDYVFNQYATGLKITKAACESKCFADCNCVAYFYNTSPGLCYLTNEVRTLKVSNNNLSAHIKI